jgi:hypothetical protein
MNQDKINHSVNKPELFIDNSKYDWEQDTITGAQIRELAGIPESAEIYQKVPGKPDQEITDITVINLKGLHGPEHFSSQAPGSQAG